MRAVPMREGLELPFSKPTTDTCKQEFGSSLYCPAWVGFWILIIDTLVAVMITMQLWITTTTATATTMMMMMTIAWMRQEKLGDLAGLSRRGREETAGDEKLVSWKTT